MCGFTGFWQLSSADNNESKATLARMADSLEHRGPDNRGFWFDDQAGICLAHRRLSILDLSQSGHQPKVSPSGRWIIVFNGEIYNHLELRDELNRSLNASSWCGSSDTETILSSLDAWGVVGTVQRLVGMFSFAVWDRKLRSLSLVRDRFGEKPLYYGWQQGAFLFGSELKALQQHPLFVKHIDRTSLAIYFRHNAIPSPYSIFSGIYKLPPGSYLTLSFEQLLSQNLPETCPYWTLANIIEEGKNTPFLHDEVAAVEVLEDLLIQAVSGQMMADVPLGAFLSGGIDSSLITALMQSISSSPVKTFSIGFTNPKFNEAVYAKDVANYLGTDHTELYVTSDDALSVVPLLPSIYDEPFADSSQIPTYLVSKLAKSSVTVTLSGDGGDELFGGYSRYFYAHHLWSVINSIPFQLRKPLGNLLFSILSLGFERASLGSKVDRFAKLLSTPDFLSCYQDLVSHWKSSSELILGSFETDSYLADKSEFAGLSIFEQMMALDSVSYLPTDILAKVDRAAMALSLETRIPLLDHRVAEFAWSLPLPLKARGNTGKWILRQLLYKYVPRELVDRPKTGFGIPIDTWLRGPLRVWANDLLNPSFIRKNGYLNSNVVDKAWNDHLSGRSNNGYLLWDILMWQSWCLSNGI